MTAILFRPQYVKINAIYEYGHVIFTQMYPTLKNACDNYHEEFVQATTP